jgi:hypothetical protein
MTLCSDVSRCRVVKLRLGLVLAAWLVSSRSAQAIVDAASRTNTTAPADGSPWASVGHIGSATGIYVGAGWVLTAAHVGAGEAEFEGLRYAWDGGFRHLTNSDGTFTDMVMFHLATLPPLPRLTLASATPASGSLVNMFGYGYMAGSAATNIDGYTGFYWSAAPAKSRGNNRTGGTYLVDAGYGNVTVFATAFNSTSQTSDEAQAAPGDSGGGAFYKSGTTWQLTGMVESIGEVKPQPAGASVYGQRTYFANIATYRPQITSIIAGTAPVLSIQASVSNIVISWPDSGVTYDLFSSPATQAPAWSLVTTPLALTNGQYQGLIPITNSTRYFRLKKH